MSKSYNLRVAFWRRMMYLRFKPKMKNNDQTWKYSKNREFHYGNNFRTWLFKKILYNFFFFQIVKK